jgi:hypothetical protein
MSLSQLLSQWTTRKPEDEPASTDSEQPIGLSRLHQLLLADAEKSDGSEDDTQSGESPSTADAASMDMECLMQAK